MELSTFSNQEEDSSINPAENCHNLCMSSRNSRSDTLEKPYDNERWKPLSMLFEPLRMNSKETGMRGKWAVVFYRGIIGKMGVVRSSLNRSKY